MDLTRPNSVHLSCIGLSWSPVIGWVGLGWIGFFLTHYDGLSWKNSLTWSNLTHARPYSLVTRFVEFSLSDHYAFGVG